MDGIKNSYGSQESIKFFNMVLVAIKSSGYLCLSFLEKRFMVIHEGHFVSWTASNSIVIVILVVCIIDCGFVHMAHVC